MMKRTAKIILFLFFISLISCKNNTNPYRLKYYRVHPINSGVVQFRWLDSAYRAGDTFSFATPCNKFIDESTYVIEERVK